MYHKKQAKEKTERLSIPNAKINSTYSNII